MNFCAFAVGLAGTAVALYFGLQPSSPGFQRTMAASFGLYGVMGFAMVPYLRARFRDCEADLQEIDYKIDLQRFQVSVGETRAEKILRLNDFQLRRYYEMTLLPLV